MIRQVHLNEAEYVQLYSSEGSVTNSNNCEVGCSGCNTGGGAGGGGSLSMAGEVLAGGADLLVLGQLLYTLVNPDD